MHVIAVAIGWYGYRAIERQQSTLTDVVLPVSTASQQSADRISRLQLLAPGLPLVDSTAALARLAKDLTQLLDDVSDRLSANGLDDAQTERALRSVVEALRAAVEAQEDTLDAQERFETAQARTLGELEQLQVTLDVLDTAREIDARDGLRVQEALRAIADWRAQLLNLAALREEAAIEQSAAGIRSGLREHVRSLTQGALLDRSENLARRLLGLLDGLGNASGPFTSRSHLLRIRQVAQARVTALSDRASGLASRLSELVDDQNARAASASWALSRTLSASETALFGVSLAALLLSALFTRQLVFREVVAPLAALTERTTALAQGNLEAPVPKPRFVELRAIADSLLSFRESLQRLSHADETLRAQNEQLGFANDELSRFAYAASHDLRSPLRGVKTLASFIRDDFEGPLPEPVADHLTRMEARLTKMEVLLEDLLAYSQAGKEREDFEPLSLRAAVAEAVGLLSFDSAAEIRWEGPLDEALLPPQTIRQALRNLIDNAIKHHDGRAPLEVRVRARRSSEGGTVVEVIDNGPGIPEQYRERVVEMFQTLKSAAGSQTSGMGLPMVLRLVQKAGGQLQLLDNESGSGTRVVLRFPAQVQPEARSSQ